MMLAFYMSLADHPQDKIKMEEIYYRYKKLIKYLALSKLQKEDLAEDAVHEVMLIVIRNIQKLQSRNMDEVKAFIYLVTRSVSIDMLRKEKRREAANIEDYPFLSSLNEDPQQNLGKDLIVKCIIDLPPIYREILELTAYFGLSIKECAAVLKISQPTARKRLERARKLLRTALEKGEETDA